MSGMTTQERLRMARKNKGLSQKQLAELANLNVSTISAYETGKAKISTKNIIILAKALGVTTGWLTHNDWVNMKI